MITFSALRRSMPIIGMFRSTASEYVTVVESPFPASAYEPSCAFWICPLTNVQLTDRPSGAHV